MQTTKLLLISLFALIFSGCTSVVHAPSGEPVPALKKPIPVSHHVLLISSLGTKINLVDQSDLQQTNTTLNEQTTGINRAITTALTRQLQARGHQVTAKALPSNNVLNTKDIEKIVGKWTSRMASGATLTGPARGTLTDSAKTYLNQMNRTVQAHTIVLVARDHRALATYAVNCEKNFTARVLVKFKLFIIDAQDYDILTWMPGEAYAVAANSNVCRDIKNVNKTQMNQLIKRATQPTVRTAAHMLTHALKAPL